ncbi:MAG: hypothetical protein QGF90_19565, partial [Gammaproteobacteria bacterium]|nr:hypothetical protein [Gammaproteobacteria bacterium]
REKNRDVVFFTTDLDAITLHGSELEWTQNLLVASALPLMFGKGAAPLGNSCEYMFPKEDSEDTRLSTNNVPPFRESHQTACFHSVCLALYISEQITTPTAAQIDVLVSDRLQGKTAVYEVGRNDARLLPTSNQATNFGATRFAGYNSWSANLQQALSWLLLMPPTIFLAVFAVLAWKRQRPRENEDATKVGSIVWSLKQSASLCIAGIIGMVLLLLVEAFTVAGEPLYVLEGISHWPTTLIRIQVLIFTLAFWLYSTARRRNSNRDIAEMLHIESVVDTEDSANDSPGTISGWTYRIERDNEKRQVKRNIVDIWRDYRTLGAMSERNKRVQFKVLGWFLLVGISYLWLTDHPALVRDSYLLADFLFSDLFLLIVTFASLYMISLANDVTNLCRVFIRALRRYDVVWDQSP